MHHSVILQEACTDIGSGLRGAFPLLVLQRFRSLLHLGSLAYH